MLVVLVVTNLMHTPDDNDSDDFSKELSQQSPTMFLTSSEDPSEHEWEERIVQLIHLIPGLVGTTLFIYFWLFAFEMPFQFPRSLIEFVICVGTFFLLARISRNWRRWRSIRLLLLTFIIPWVIVSIMDSAWAPTSSTPPQLAFDSKSKKSELSLNLSGGGLRAALLHSGTLDALVRLNARPGFLTSVSGGTIIASFYALGFDPRYFPTLVDSGALRVTPKLRNFLTLTRLASPASLFGFKVPWSVSRTDLLAQTLDDVFLKGKTFRNLPREGPVLLIATTDILSGSGIGITKGGLVEVPAVRAYLRQEWNNLRSLRKDVQQEIGIDRNAEVGFIPVDFDPRISRYVSASGAFPGAFTPVELTLTWRSIEPLYDLGNGLRAIPMEQDQLRTFRLADGGITDNSGYLFSEAMRHLSNAFLRRDLVAQYYLEKLNHNAEYKSAFVKYMKSQSRPEATWRYKHVLVSDAGERFSDASRVDSLLAQASRSLDVIYSNTGLGRIERFPDRDQEKIKVMPSRIDCLAEQERNQLSKRTVPDCDDEHRLNQFSAGSAWLQKKQDELGAVESHWLLGPHAWPDFKTKSTGSTYKMLTDTYRAQKCAQATALLDPEVWGVIQASDPVLASSLKRYREDLKHLDHACPDGHTSEPVTNIDAVLASHIKRAKKVFDTTATLDDTIGLAAAEQIAFLGRISVLLSWPDIRRTCLRK